MSLCYFDGTASHTINSFTGGTHQLCISKSNGVTERFPLTNLTTAWLPGMSDRKGGQPVISYGYIRHQIAQSYSMSHSLRASLSQISIQVHDTGSIGHVYPLFCLAFSSQPIVRETTYLNAQAENRDYRRCYWTTGQNVSLIFKMLSASQSNSYYTISGGGYARTGGASMSINASGMRMIVNYLTVRNSYFLSNYPSSMDLVFPIEHASSSSTSHSAQYGQEYISQSISATYVRYRSSLSTKFSLSIRGPTNIVSSRMTPCVYVDFNQTLCRTTVISNMSRMNWDLLDDDASNDEVYMRMSAAAYGLTASWIRGANSNNSAWFWGTNNTSTTWQTITASCSAWFNTSASNSVDTHNAFATASTSAWNNINL